MGLFEQHIEILKACNIEVRVISNNRFSGWFNGRAIVQQLNKNGTGYVPSSLVQKITNEFDIYSDERNYIKFKSLSPEKFKRLIEVAKEASYRL